MSPGFEVWPLEGNHQLDGWVVGGIPFLIPYLSHQQVRVQVSLGCDCSPHGSSVNPDASDPPMEDLEDLDPPLDTRLFEGPKSTPPGDLSLKLWLVHTDGPDLGSIVSADCTAEATDLDPPKKEATWRPLLTL